MLAFRAVQVSGAIGCHVNSHRVLPETLEELARVASGLESPAEAAGLLGVASAARATIGLPRPVMHAERFAALEAELRDALGSEAFDAAHTE